MTEESSVYFQLQDGGLPYIPQSEPLLASAYNDLSRPSCSWIYPSSLAVYPGDQVAGYQAIPSPDLNYVMYAQNVQATSPFDYYTKQQMEHSSDENLDKTSRSSSTSNPDLSGESVRSSSVKKDQKVVKTGPGEWTCKVCNRAFSRNDRARAHEARHNGIFAYPCEGGVGHKKCGRSFVSPEALRSHCNRSDIICNVCRATVRKRNFARHMRECHSS